MKAKEIRNTEKSALDEKMEEMKKELVKMKAQMAVGATIKNPGLVRKMKKIVARIITINQEKRKKRPEVGKPG